MSFPVRRLRRLRMSAQLRSMVQETSLSASDFILPLFICPGEGVRTPVESMPGVFRLSVDEALKECRRVHSLGIRAVLLFGVPEHKSEFGETGADENGIVQRAIRAIKEQIHDIVLISDVCNCPYTLSGHCGVFVNGKMDNDRTIDLLARQALSHARAGSDMVAPSDMMDGRVGALRQALDLEGFKDLSIMSYAVKYASAFYGPFREAVDCAPKTGDRKTYQMNPANSDEALREVELDIHEGADIIMVKPALSYLDIIRNIKGRFNVPVAAYNVSGEYAMVMAAAQRGWIDERAVMMEMLLSMKRAGADMIISYYAAQAASILREEAHG